MPTIFILFLFTFFPALSHSTPEYAQQTGWECKTCHIDTTSGKRLTKAGEDFREDLRIGGLYRPLNPVQRMVRLIIGYLHLLAAIAWFGTILYVHILLKPAYAARGLPKGELILGWFGIATLSITGVLLTIARIPTWKVFYTTRFGILLSVKIFLFLVMVTTAVIVTFVIGSRLRGKSVQLDSEKGPVLPQNKNRFTVQDLLHFDGKENRPAYLAYRGKIYDVSSSRLWKEGGHVKKHLAGDDLTDSLKTAPHEEDKIFQMPVVGELIPSEFKVQVPIHERAFYFMAYMNLVFVFLITFVIALWRWG
jgi:predicted heme/steroid binding protein/uncharacterized membrane protein